MYVLDASALIALIHKERGAEQVTRAIASGAVMSAVNLGEFSAVYIRLGNPEEKLPAILEAIDIDIIPFDREQAYVSGRIILSTAHAGLSFGDRACLALAKKVDGTALTSDANWEKVDAGVRIELISQHAE